MGLLSRLKDISTGKLITFLDEAERPEQLIPQLLDELSSQRQALRNAETKSLTAVRAAQRRLEETMGRALRLKRGAELALSKGEEATAREALREQIKVDQAVPRQREQVEQAQKILDNVREQSGALREQIVAVKEKQARLKATPPPSVSSSSSEPLLRKVAQMEERTVSEEIEQEARREVFQRKRSLDERLIELERSEEIEKRLNLMKKDEHP